MVATDWEAVLNDELGPVPSSNGPVDWEAELASIPIVAPETPQANGRASAQPASDKAAFGYVDYMPIPQSSLDRWKETIRAMPEGPEKKKMVARHAQAQVESANIGYERWQAAQRGLTWTQQIASQTPEEQFLAHTPQPIRAANQGVTDVSKELLNLVDVLAPQKTIDQRNRAMAFQRALNRAYDRESFLGRHVSPKVGELAGEATSVLTEVGVASAISPSAVIPYFFGKTASETYTADRDAGMSDLKALLHSTATGALQAGLMVLAGSVGEKLGLVTREELFSKQAQNVASKLFSKAGLTTFLKETGFVAGEGAAIQAATNVLDKVAGTRPDALDPKQFFDSVVDAALSWAVVGAAGTAAHAIPAGVRTAIETARSRYVRVAESLPQELQKEVADHQKQIIADVEKKGGTPSRSQASDLGADKTESQTAVDRRRWFEENESRLKEQSNAPPVRSDQGQPNEARPIGAGGQEAGGEDLRRQGPEQASPERAGEEAARQVTDADIQGAYEAARQHAIAERRRGRRVDIDEAVSQVDKAWETYDPSKGPFDAYAGKFVTQYLKNARRAKGRELAAQEAGNIPSREATPQDQAIKNEQQTARQAAIDQLSELDREFLTQLMRGKSQRAVAKELGISPQAISRRFMRIRAELRAKGEMATADFSGLPIPDEVVRKMPGYGIGRSLGKITEGSKSLLLPTSKSPEHLQAAEIVGSHLGHRSHLAEASAYQLKPVKKYFDRLGVESEKLTPETNQATQFMSAMSTGEKLPPKPDAMAKRIDRELKRRTDELESLDAPVEGLREHYFPGMWTLQSREAFNRAYSEAVEADIIPEGSDPNQSTREQRAWVKERVDQYLKEGTGDERDQLSYFTNRPLHGKQEFRKQKVFDDIMVAQQFGLRPFSNNPADLVMLKLASLDRAIMAERIFADPEWKSRTIKPSERVPEGWAKIDDPYGTVYGPSTLETPEGEQVYAGRPIFGYRIVPEAQAEILNNYLSSSLYNSPYFGELYKGWMTAANALNQTQLGLGSAFHVSFTTGEAQVSAGAEVAKDIYGLLRGNRTPKQLGRTLGRMFTAMGRSGLVGDKVLDAWRNPDGSISPEIAQIVKAAELGGGGFTLERGLMTTASERIVRDWTSGKKLSAIAKSPLAFTEALSAPIMRWIVPRQKAGVFAEMAGRIIEQNPGVALEDLRSEFRQAWNRVDARLGQVRYKRLFQPKRTKEALQASVRAPGWTFGTVAEIGGAFTDTAKFVAEWNKTGKLPAELPDRVAYTMSLLTMGAVANGVLTYLLTGDKPEGMDFWAFRDGGTDEQGRPTRKMLPTYNKDLLAWYEDPGQTAINKTHPLVSMVTQLAQNEDYYGVEIRHPGDPVKEQAADTGEYVVKQFVPFWVRGAQKTHEQGGGAGEMLAAYFGIMPAPRHITETKAEKMAWDFVRESLPSAARTKEQFEKSRGRAELRKQVSGGDTTVLNQQLDAGKLNKREARDIYRRAQSTPLQNAIRNLTAEQGIQIWEVASKEERTQIKDSLDKKLVNAINSRAGENSDQLIELIHRLKYDLPGLSK